MKVAIRKHEWRNARGEKRAASFFPFVNDVPRHDITCDNCVHLGDNYDCAKIAEVGADDKCYAFCGTVCGYFALDDTTIHEDEGGE